MSTKSKLPHPQDDRHEDEVLSEGLPRSEEFDARWRETRERRELARSFVAMRRTAGLTQVELAQRMGKDQAFLSRMESATAAMPKAQHVALYAKHCGYMTAYAFLEQPTDEEITLHELRPIGQELHEMALMNTIRDVHLEDAEAVRPAVARKETHAAAKES